MKGFSPRNLKYMRAFAAAWPQREFVQQVAAQIPWYHHIALLEKLKDPYLFDFLGTTDPRREKEVEQALVDHIQRFLLELGTEFAFLNLYLSAVDDLLRHPDDQPTIGLLLCREKNRIVVEYALRNLKRPIGVAEWETKIVEKLPKRLVGSLPTVEEIEAELGEGQRKQAKRVKGTGHGG